MCQRQRSHEADKLIELLRTDKIYGNESKNAGGGKSITRGSSMNYVATNVKWAKGNKAGNKGDKVSK